ncbi:hypothetical protein ACLQ2Q_13405 [Microbacterium sp. DT81.1]|uniref:hypothetical protein n=1 Tax=Microbacterium sp. DT81.1 TaxID=3393413 RepID=UPI003CEA5D91
MIETLTDAVATGLATLAGVALTGLITIVVLLVQRRWTESDRAATHQHDETLVRLTLGAQDQQVQQTRRLACAAEFLAETQSCYSEVVRARRNRREARDDEVYRSALRAISGKAGQVALEVVGLLFDPDSTASAQRLWTHIRGEAVPTGVELGSAEWVTWKNRYWELRGDCTSAFRLAPLGADAPVGSGPR